MLEPPIEVSISRKVTQRIFLWINKEMHDTTSLYLISHPDHYQVWILLTG